MSNCGVGRPPDRRPASARDVGRSDVRQFFPLAHLAPIFTQSMGGSSTHDDTAKSSTDPIVLSDAPPSAPTATALGGGQHLEIVHFFSKTISRQNENRNQRGGGGVVNFRFSGGGGVTFQARRFKIAKKLAGAPFLGT